MSIFQRVFSAFWGPRTDDLMRAACLTLAAQPTPRTLADLPALLTDADVRARHLRAVHDPLLRGFWNWYDQLSEPARAQVTAPLMNKIRALLLRPFTRAVLTGSAPPLARHRHPRPAPRHVDSGRRDKHGDEHGGHARRARRRDPARPPPQRQPR